MKFRVLYIFIITMFIASGCVKIERNREEMMPSIVYNVVMGAHTKADAGPLDGPLYPTSESFRSIAWKNNDGSTLRSEAAEYIPESTVSHYGGYWSTAAEYYWPSGSYLTFISWSPADLSVTPAVSRTGNISLTGFNVENEQKDFMIADIRTNEKINYPAGIAGNNTPYNGVPTVFRHKLSCVKFEVRKDNADADLRIFGLKLTNYHASGSYTMTLTDDTWDEVKASWGTDEAWTTNGSPITSSIYENEYGLALSTAETTVNGKGKLLIPQTLMMDNDDDSKATCIEVTFGKNAAEAVTRLVNLPKNSSTAWETGKMITYTLTLSEIKNIEFTAGTADWINDSGDVTVGEK